MDTPYGSAPLPVWERPEPQPRAAPVPLSRAKIAATAIRLADAHGLDYQPLEDVLPLSAV